MFLVPHLGTIIWLAIIFSIVWIILSKFAWKPLMKALDDRQSSIERSLKSAEEARLSLATVKKEQELLIDEARQMRDQLIREAYRQQDKILAEARLNAQQSFDSQLENARRQIEQEKKAAVHDIKNQIAQLSVEIASRLIKSELGEKTRQERLVNELINDITIN